MNKNWITFDLDKTIMQNPFQEWVFPEIVSLINNLLSDKLDVKALIVEEHLKKMSKGKFLEAYDWDEIVRNLLFNLEIETKIDVESLVIKHSSSPKIYLLENNMLERLDTIKEKGYKLAAVTNGYFKYQYPVMQHLKLDTVFDEIITSDSAGFAKPDTSIIEKSALRNKVIAHVGDRIDHDIVMANQLRITSIFINRTISKGILELPINKRVENLRFQTFCEEKWHRENELRESEFDKEKYLPNLVISSIKEMSEQMDYINFE